MRSERKDVDMNILLRGKNCVTQFSKNYQKDIIRQIS